MKRTVHLTTPSPADIFRGKGRKENDFMGHSWQLDMGHWNMAARVQIRVSFAFDICQNKRSEFCGQNVDEFWLFARPLLSFLCLFHNENFFWGWRKKFKIQPTPNVKVFDNLMTCYFPCLFWWPIEIQNFKKICLVECSWNWKAGLWLFNLLPVILIRWNLNILVGVPTHIPLCW